MRNGIARFQADSKLGLYQALTMTVAANCKQVLTIVIAVFLFNLKINFTNGIGIMLTLIGGVSKHSHADNSSGLTHTHNSR
jgi:hypothetical protein